MNSGTSVSCIIASPLLFACAFRTQRVQNYTRQLICCSILKCARFYCRRKSTLISVKPAFASESHDQADFEASHPNRIHSQQELRNVTRKYIFCIAISSIAFRKFCLPRSFLYFRNYIVYIGIREIESRWGYEKGA